MGWDRVSISVMRWEGTEGGEAEFCTQCPAEVAQGSLHQWERSVEEAVFPRSRWEGEIFKRLQPKPGTR